MYLPAAFEQQDPDALAALMRAHPLATVIGPPPVAGGAPTADWLPLDHDAEAGVLRGHVARANPLWRQADGRPVLALFHGPQGYVSPNWYPSKAQTHKAVPTWNYAVVQAHGTLRAIDGDPGWLLALLRRLTSRHEAREPQPWSPDDAPADYLQQMMRAVVGIEIGGLTLVGKWKTSQNRSADDRAGVAAALRAIDAAPLAALVDDPLSIVHQETPR